MVEKLQERDEAYGQTSFPLTEVAASYLRRREVLKCTKLSSDTRMLDIGCGYDALFLQNFATTINSGVGIDFSISDTAKSIKNLSFLEGTIEEHITDLESESFDVILAISVLEHLWNPQSVISECNRILTKGGKLIINLPTWFGKYPLELVAFKLGLGPKVEMDDHKLYYNKRNLWPIIRNSGFRPSLIKMRYYRLGMALMAVATKDS